VREGLEDRSGWWRKAGGTVDPPSELARSLG